MSLPVTGSPVTPVAPAPAGGSRVEGGMSFAAVLREAQGVKPLPPPPRFDHPPDDLAERARRALYDVSDPEFPISIVDLGLVYGVSADESARRVTVDLTFTATACPCMDFITWDVRERLVKEPDIDQVSIEVVWDPPWTADRITDRGREILRDAGVSA